LPARISSDDIVVAISSSDWRPPRTYIDGCHGYVTAAWWSPLRLTSRAIA
jgi:hypothetical protein